MSLQEFEQTPQSASVTALVRRTARGVTWLTLCALIAACGGGEKYQAFDPNSDFFGADETIDNAATINNPDLLDARVSYPSETIDIEDPVTGTSFGAVRLLNAETDGVSKELDGTGGASSDFAIQAIESIDLTLIAEIASPVVGGDTLQATSVALSIFDRGMVSYNLRGEARKGAVDWIGNFSSDEPRVLSQVVFNDTDVNHVSALGSAVYAASATDDPNVPFAAVLDRVPLRSDRFTLVSYLRQPLTSFAATSVFRTGSTLYVTSGNAGEITAHSSWTLDERGAYPLHDARWAALAGDRLVVAQGTPGQLSVFEAGDFPGGSLTLLNTFPFPGADVPEAKTTVDVAGDHAFVAAGAEGVQIVCLDDGAIVGNVPRPDPASLGLDPSVVVTNAVSVDDDLMFISNGEAGVYVAAAEDDFDDYDCDEAPSLAVLGQLQFGELESVNHVEYEDDYLFVAAGLGGVKIVSVETDDDDDDDDDDEDEDD
ncbi:MAG: hypothetical protein AAGE43_01755 [Pseudomonadota bacterium]